MCECVIVEGKTGGIRLKWGNVVPKEGGGEREGQGARLNKTFMSIPQSGGPFPFPLKLCILCLGFAVSGIVVDLGVGGGRWCTLPNVYCQDNDWYDKGLELDASIASSQDIDAYDSITTWQQSSQQ